MTSFDSDSLSPPSEPPDIVNWFSSYVYESPVLDSNDGIDTCIFKESELHKDGFAIEEDTTSRVLKEDGSREIRKPGSRNELDFCQKRTSNVAVECPDYLLGTTNQNSKGNQWIKMAKDIVISNNLPSNMFSDQCLEEKTPKHYKRTSVQNSERSKLEDIGLEESEVISLYINKSKNDIESSKTLLSGDIFIKDESHVNAQTEKIYDCVIHAHLNSIPTGTTSFKNGNGNRKENGSQTICEGNGFISTRKKGKATHNDENFRPRTEKAKSGNLRHVKEVVSASERNAVSAKRKVLTETTNNVQSSETLEAAGKWRCPQKSKPNIGPPLKQLRLEQWVRRV